MRTTWTTRSWLRSLGAAMLLAVGLALAAPAMALAQAAEDAPYHSPLRGQCNEELRKDKTWRAMLEKELRVKIHQQEHDLIAANKKHVYMGYGALWVIITVFVVFQWRKQKSMTIEVERLQAEVERMSSES